MRKLFVARGSMHTCCFLWFLAGFRPIFDNFKTVTEVVKETYVGIPALYPLEQKVKMLSIFK